MEAYKTWVRRNHQWLGSIESIANTMTWLLPERFASSELAPEAVSTLVGLVTLMNQHIVDTAPKPGHHFGSSPDQGLPWSIFVSVVKEFEVLVEMVAEQYKGEDGKWTALAVVEAIKALLRLRIFHDSGYKMLLDGGETENQESGASHCDPLTGGLSASYGRRGRAMEAFYKFGDSFSAKPSWKQRPKASPPVVQKQPSILTVWNQPGPVTKLLLLAEVIGVLRPLIYVLFIRRHGIKSWRPWLASFAVDMTSLSLLYFSDSLVKKQKTSGAFSSAEKQEVKRRQILLALYLLRSPFFDRYSRHQLERVERVVRPLPLFGFLTGKAMELLTGVQSIYSYTSGS